MLALVLWLEIGWRAGVVELLAEAALGAALIGGGGGGRLVRGLRAVALRPRRRVRAIPA